jgi:hypothetical protein
MNDVFCVVRRTWQWGSMLYVRSYPILYHETQCDKHISGCWELVSRELLWLRYRGSSWTQSKGSPPLEAVTKELGKTQKTEKTYCVTVNCWSMNCYCYLQLRAVINPVTTPSPVCGYYIQVTIRSYPKVKLNNSYNNIRSEELEVYAMKKYALWILEGTYALLLVSNVTCI